MKLTPNQREGLRSKYRGLCAYCGSPLGQNWHVDHLEPVWRESQWVSGKGFVATGAQAYPERDCLENAMPACVSCNLSKSALPLEVWRQKIADWPNVLARNSPTYRNALRFGRVTEARQPVVFHFEKMSQE